MLQLVYNTWIAGVLKHSLHGAARLELGKTYAPDTVERPWDLELHLPGQARRSIPPNISILEIFSQCSGALLILGDPGSGKTTTMLELARDLIRRAEVDDTAHIPVIFNLSSWAAKQQSLETWLLEELRVKYLIPSKVAQAWIKKDMLLLLLDGLDEVKTTAREKCVAAINAFREEHLVPQVVCSRAAEYEHLIVRLRLQGAVFLMPLTPKLIDQYLMDVNLRALRTTIQHDLVLQEMARNPLMLSIMTLAYRTLTVEQLQMFDLTKTRRQHLFGAYIQHMFQRRARSQPYNPEETCHWLNWLATKMFEQEQSVFLIENLQPAWLPNHDYRRTRRLALLFFSVVFGLVIGLFLTLVVGGSFQLAMGVMDKLGSTALSISLSRLYGEVRQWLAVGVGVGAVGGLVIGLFSKLDAVRLVETLSWSREAARKKLGFGVIVGLVMGLVWGTVFGLINGWITGLFFGLGGALFGGVFSGLIWGLTIGETASKTTPNQGIRHSFRNAVYVGLIFGIVFGLTWGMVFGIGFGAWFKLDRQLPTGRLCARIGLPKTKAQGGDLWAVEEMISRISIESISRCTC